MGIEEPLNTDWDSDRKWSIGVSVAAALFLIGKMVADRDLLLNGRPNLGVFAAIGFLMIAGGLFYRKEWSRWALLAVCIFAAIVVVRNAINDGPTLITWLLLIVLPFGFWTVLKMPITGAQAVMAAAASDMEGFNQRVQKRFEVLESQKNWKIELTFAKPLQLTAQNVASAIAGSSDHKFTVLDREIDPIDASFLPEEHPEPTIAGRFPIFTCSVPPNLFGIYLLNREADDEASESSQKPQCWLQIELLPQISRREAVENGYQRTGPIASAFLSDDCLQVLLAEADLCVPNKSGLRSALLSEDPHSALLRLMD